MSAVRRRRLSSLLVFVCLWISPTTVGFVAFVGALVREIVSAVVGALVGVLVGA